MAKIEIKADCGNAPRKVFLADLTRAYADGDVSLLEEYIPDDIILEIVGSKKVFGKEHVLNELSKSPLWKLKQLTVDTIITHGRDAAVSGQIKLFDNAQFSFCDVYKFKGAGGTTIKEILRFLVKNKSEKD